MSYYDALAKQAQSVEINEQPTSYFSKTEQELDPRLFRQGKLIPAIRSGILSLLFNHLNQGYSQPDSWLRAYLAGSGVSFNWSAAREPADLDCLVSIDYVQFRQSNQEYKGWSDSEIAAEFNQGFKNELLPKSNNFMDTFELTYYVNVNPDIKALKPYAAYSVTDDLWVVPPSELKSPVNPEWELAVERDKTRAIEIVKRYSIAWDAVKNATNTAMRLNAETTLSNAISQGSALFRDIHESRSQAFSPEGKGYADFYNYRWQSGKQSGIVPAMKKLHDISSDASSNFATETYGMTLPDTATLLRRAQRSNH